MARHLQAPYRLVQMPSEVHLEVPLPFWVHPTEDVKVVIGPRQLTVDIDGFMRLNRTYYFPHKQGGDCQVRIIRVLGGFECVFGGGGGRGGGL